MTVSAKEIQKLRWFHGHTCPMSTLGMRAGRMARKMLRIRTRDSRHVEVSVYFKSCASDGIQVAFPATLGNGNLMVFNDGDMRFVFHDTRTRASLTLRFSPSLHTVMEHYLLLRKLAGDRRNTDSKRALNEAYADFLDVAQHGRDENIFISAYDAGVPR